MNIINALKNYLTADSPERRTKALDALIDAYNVARSLPDQETLGLSPADIASFKALAARAGLDSAAAVLSAIAGSPPLMEGIAGYLSTPTAEAATGLPEIVIRPAQPVSRAIARIGLRADQVTVLLPEKRDDFRDMVKNLGYAWDGDAWAKPVKNWGSAANAAAELGHHLLAAGFWVAPPTPQVRDLIIKESFEPEVRRKVMARASGQYSGWLVLWWARSEDCYTAASRISGSRYDKPVVVVPPEFYDEVEDFAARHNFAITPAAAQIIERARAALNAALLVQVELTEPDDAPANGQPLQLTVPDDIGIDDDLADND